MENKKGVYKVVFRDLSGKEQTTKIFHDGTDDCWDSKEIDGIMYDFNTFDYDDEDTENLQIGIMKLNNKDENGFYTLIGCDYIYDIILFEKMYKRIKK